MSNRIFSYARVSTMEQTTENQKIEIQNYVENVLKEKFNEKRFFCENISGSVPAEKRPEFQKMLNKLEEGDIVVVSKVDRLGRNARDILNTLHKIQNELKAEIHIVAFKIDLSTPVGKMFLSMTTAFAEMERDLIIERTKAGLARAKLQGRVGGKPSIYKILEKKGLDVNDIMVMRDKQIPLTKIAKDVGISNVSVYRLVKKENEKYKKYIEKYFDIKKTKIRNCEVIQSVDFQPNMRSEWFSLTDNLKRIYINSITNNDLKNRILLFLGLSENMEFSVK